METREGNTPLHIAAGENNSTELSNLLADSQCNPNARNKEGDTPLHVAVRKNSKAVLSQLLAHQQCNPNTQNKEGDTPLHVAVRENSKASLSQLLTLAHQQCNPNIFNKEGDTPLHIAVRNNQTAVISKLLGVEQCNPNAKNKEGDTPLHIAVMVGSLQFCETIAANIHCDVNTLNKAHMTPLLSAIKHGKPSVATALLQHRKCDFTICDPDGNTALHLACIVGETQEEMVKIARMLLKFSNVDPSSANHAGQTPIELTTKYQLIQAISHFTKCKTKHSVQTYINLFIVGNPETGKSALVKAMCKEAGILWKFLPKVLRRVKNVPPHTAGIIPTIIQSKIFGNIFLYDLAGQIEYYTSHAAVVQTIGNLTPSAFIVVVNMSESKEKISQTLRYWWSFINNLVAQASAPPQVILVGSHADKVKARGESVQEKMSQMSTLLKHVPASFHFAGQVALDCRDPASRKFQLFCSLVNNTYIELRQTADVDLRCNVLYALLLEKFPGRVACTVSDIAYTIQESDALLPQNPDGLIPLISTLSDMGFFFLLRDSVSSEHSWVILQKQVLLGEINGTIFAPKHFSQHKSLSSSTGVVPLLKLKSEFPDYNPTMIAKFLTHLKLCFKVDDHETLELLRHEVVYENIPRSLSEEFYFFPALVSVENPLQVWEQDDVMLCQSGWFYQCIRHDQFLTAQFLHVLILRLAFSFALKLDPGDSLALHRQCSVWKRGIGWLNKVPIETVVEVGLLNQSVIVMMRCPKGEEAKCAHLRSEITQKVIEAKDEHCETVQMSEAFIHPTDIKYPFIDNTEDLKYYSLSKIARAAVNEAANVLDSRGRYPFPVKDLLLFDPQTTTSRELLIELFSEKHSLDEQVRGQLLENLFEATPQPAVTPEGAHVGGTTVEDMQDDNSQHFVSAPTITRLEPLNSTTFALEWQPSTVEVDNLHTIRSWEVEYEVVGVKVRKAVETINDPDTTAHILTVDKGTQYRVRVAGQNVQGRKYLSPYTMAATPVDPPSMPQNLRVEVVVDEFALKTSWDAPSDNGGSQVVSYTIQIREVVENKTITDFTALAPMRVINASQVQFTYTIRDSLKFHLTKNTVYEVQVAANNVAGPGQVSTTRGRTVDKVAYEKALQKERLMPLCIAQCMTVGAPQTGKSSLKRRLLKQTDGLNKSTGVADKPVVTAVTADDTEWTALDWEDEGAQFLQIIEQPPFRIQTETNQLPKPPIDISGISEQTKVLQDSHSPREVPRTKEPVQDFAMSAGIDTDSVPHQYSSSSSNSTVMESSMDQKEAEPPCASYLDLIDTILDVGSEKWIAAKKRLENQCTIYFTDTGGQLEFQEVLPAIISGPSIFLLAFNLEHAAKGLHKEFPAVYKRGDGSVYEPPAGISTFTVKDSILHILASIQSTRSYQFEKEGNKQKIEAKVLLVGTHSDHVSDVNVRNQIECDVQNLLEKTPYYLDGMLQVPCKKQSSKRFVYMVNNLDVDDPVFQEIRGKIRSLIFKRPGDSDYKEDISAYWLGFDLMLRMPGKSKILSYQQCVDLANRCGIKEDDVEKALTFLHERFGIIRYFKGEGLGHIVITNPQVIYNMLSDLIAEQFNDGNSDCRLTPKQVNDFRNKGLISLDAVNCIAAQRSERPDLVSFLLRVLCHLHIVVKLEGDERNPETTYFMPCVLAGTMHDLFMPEENSEPSVADLLIVFDRGRQYCPKGLFSVLAVKLAQRPKELEANYTWVLNREDLARDRVVFHINVKDPYCRYTVYIQHGFVGSRTVLKFFVGKLLNRECIQLHPENLGSVCKKICDSVKSAVKSSLEELHKCINFNIGFYSTCKNQSSHETHIAIIEDLFQHHSGVPPDMTCIDCKNVDYPLEEEHKVWFKEVPQVIHSRSQVSPRLPITNFVKAEADKKLVTQEVADDTLQYQIDVSDGVDDSTLGEQDLHGILSAVIEVAAKWKCIGDMLRLSSGALASIETANHYQPNVCLREVILIWLKGSSYSHCPPTWRWLVEVVRSPAGGDNPALARRIASQHSKVPPQPAQFLNTAQFGETTQEFMQNISQLSTTHTAITRQRGQVGGAAQKLVEADISQQCTKPTLPELLKFTCTDGRVVSISEEIATKYVRFGTFLLDDRNGSRVKIMASKHHYDPERINTEILQEWLNGRGKQPVTWATLVEVLHDIELSTLAGDISTSKCPSKQRTAWIEMHEQIS